MVGSYVITGFIFAVFFCLLFWGAAQPKNQQHYLTRLLLILIFTGSLLSLQSLLPLYPILTLPVLFTLTAFAIRGWHAYLFSNKTKPKFEFKWSLLLALIIILVESLWAAFPEYRKDQWNYSLVIAKMIAEQGKLLTPILSDHTYFTGGYEYLFTLFRLLTTNDLVVQSAANCFGFLMILIFFGVFLSRHVKRFYLLPLMAFCFYTALPEHDAIYNAKPDIWLLALALVLFQYIQDFIDSPETRRTTIFYGTTLLVGGIALKFSWIHFGAVYLATTGILISRTPQRRQFLAPACWGAILGTLAILPIISKNIAFFGNPLHPVQIAFLKSNYLPELISAYWETVLKQAHSFSAYFHILQKLPGEYVWRTVWLIPLLGISLYFYMAKNLSFQKQAKTNRLLAAIIICTMFYLLAWPVFYHQEIFGRFVYVLFAMPIFVICISFSNAHQKFQKLFIVLLFIPVLATSSLEYHFLSLTKHFTEDVETFYVQKKYPLHWAIAAQQVNTHRTPENIPLPYHKSITLADDPPAYLFDGGLLYTKSYEYTYYRSQFSSLEDFIDSFDIRYFSIRQEDGFPAEYLKILKSCIKISEHPLVYYRP